LDARSSKASPPPRWAITTIESVPRIYLVFRFLLLRSIGLAIADAR
jgi:hypothetical protein